MSTAGRLRLFCAVGLFCLLSLLSASPASAQVVDVVGNIVPFVEYNTNFGPGIGYKDWGNEPFIAVNPVDPNKIVISGFAYGSPTGSIWYSQDGGATWGARFPITRPFAGTNVPNDQVFAYDSLGTLHAVMLGSAGSNRNIYHGFTTDPNNDGFFGRPATTWTWTTTVNNNRINQAGVNTADQPWIAINGNQLFAAYDSFNAGGNAVEMRLLTSNDLGLTFPTDIAISRGGQIGITTNPGLRIAADAAGNVYAAFGYGTTSVGGVQNVTYRLNRNADFNLANPNPGGLIVDSGNSAQIGSSFGGKNELRGNTTAIDVTQDGSHVYYVYGKRDANNVDRLWLSEFHPDGLGGLAQRPNPVAFSVAGQWAALPSITVTDSGLIGIIYMSVTAPGAYDVHCVISTDLGLTFDDQVIYSFDTTGFTLGTTAFPSGNRMLGDYLFLTSLGDTIYGTFPGRGNVNGGGYNTTGNIDPFFFSRRLVPADVPEPGTMAFLLCMGAGGFSLFVRRRRS